MKQIFEFFILNIFQRFDLIIKFYYQTSIKKNYNHFAFCNRRMTFFHFINCLALACSPYYLTYRFAGLYIDFFSF